MVGIYRIVNKINNKSYVGASINIERRWRQHKNCKINSPLYNDFITFGIENFSFEVLELCEKEELNEKESFYIQKYNCSADGYNKTLDNANYAHSPVFTQQSLNSLFDLLQHSQMQQKELALLFNCSARTIRDINNGKAWHRKDLTYPIRKFWIDKHGNEYPYHSKEKEKCPICGNKKNKYSNLCKDCGYNKQRRVQRPLKETLATEIVENGFENTGKKYNVTGNSIRKWCKAYQIPCEKEKIKQWLLENKK